MASIRLRIYTALSVTFALSAGSYAFAQNATVTVTSQKQYIRGYGGMQHGAWAGTMTAAEQTLAFGNAAGQLGLSILRIPVTDGNPGSGDVASAKAAIAAGGIVLATPWNAAKTYTSADFAAYATHLNNFVTYMKGQGAELYAISVQNEPDYGATAGWGSWSETACHDFVVNYGSTITTKLMGCESFNYKKSYYDAILNDSAALANVDLFGTHLYGTPVSGYAYSNFFTKGAGKEMWMTEHYTDSNTDANSWPNALGVATELHNSMVTAQFNAYIWWYIKRSYGFINNGAVTKRGWCMAHWSKYVRPGFHRVDATATPASNVLLSAFAGDTGVVIVAVNNNSSASSLNITVNGSSIASYDKYTTSSSKSMGSDGKITASNGAMTVPLDGSSVTTLVGSGSVSPGAGGASTGGATGAGGATTGGATTATGGKASAGGGPGAGGAVATGGKASAGGANPVNGGSSATGGAVANGGNAVTGGKAATTGGASTSNGGNPATGGNLSSGGSNSATGGSVGGPATGGAATGNGGATSPGNGGATVSATGGSNGVGGSNSAVGGQTIAGGDLGTDEGGCSCTVAGRRSSGAMLGFALGAIAVLARRRRR